MDENILTTVLEQLYYEEFSDFDNSIENKFSIKHILAMKRIFKIYDKNTKNLRLSNYHIVQERKFKLNSKRIVIIAMIVFLATIAGCATAYFVSKNFQGDVHSEYTRLMATDIEGCFETIEYTYCFSEIPNGFVLVEKEESMIDAYLHYSDDCGRSLIMHQWVKKNFTPQYNTENIAIEDIEINGYNAICLDFSDDETDSVLIAWDNGDYIIEIMGNLSKEDLKFLAENAEISKN